VLNNGTIIAEVTKRAKASANRDEMTTLAWEQHWVDTGVLWANECQQQGLTETAITIAKHIDWFKRNSLSLAS
jgi:hypothetical protein